MTCKLVGLLQATTVFVSTITITAIAVHRRRFIMGNKQENQEEMGKILATLPLIWCAALLMASPLAIWKTLEKWTGWTENFLRKDGSKYFTYDGLNYAAINDTWILGGMILSKLTELQTCKEAFPKGGRLAFSIFVFLFQFILPIVIILPSYYQICRTLKERLELRKRQIQVNLLSRSSPRKNSVLIRNDQRRQSNILRLKRTKMLLCWIGAIFCICWIPLNIFNVVMDATAIGDLMTDDVFCGIYAVCHMLGMLSACANPLIYGFFNEKFSKEFKEMGFWWKDTFQAFVNYITVFCKQFQSVAPPPSPSPKQENNEANNNNENV